MSWFDRLKPPKISTQQKRSDLPEGLWEKCKSCGEIIFHEDLKQNLMVCPQCSFHMAIPTRDRLDIILDQDSFEELDENMKATDPLQFRDLKKYKDRIKAYEKVGGEKEAFIYGRGNISGLPIIIGSFVFEYMGGSMGSVVGEKITRTYELALEERKPCLIITASGGARMQEGILSLMQMAKTTAALSRLRNHQLPFIVLLTHPTTGGVAASIAMLGDIILAEPNALIGFAGPRVIEQTIKEKLPSGFQRSEFLLEHGMIDQIITRSQLKSKLHFFFDSLMKNAKPLTNSF
ncbi:MAG: acetyl-CoA carboxylase carboxyltransferase subunit beta [Bdellovibrionales bacterium]|nr:acetyl-CoA carboxylase carboxyltransferase subunit beta [Bdellovibrionales bacterium]